MRGLDGDLAAIDDPEEPNDDCSGGAAIAVEISSGDTSFEREVSSCGSDHNQLIDHQLDQVLAPTYEAVDLEALTAADCGRRRGWAQFSPVGGRGRRGARHRRGPRGWRR